MLFFLSQQTHLYWENYHTPNFEYYDLFISYFIKEKLFHFSGTIFSGFFHGLFH